MLSDVLQHSVASRVAYTCRSDDGLIKMRSLKGGAKAATHSHTTVGIHLSTLHSSSRFFLPRFYDPKKNPMASSFAASFIIFLSLSLASAASSRDLENFWTPMLFKLALALSLDCELFFLFLLIDEPRNVSARYLTVNQDPLSPPPPNYI